jgi:hypothetical protein
MLSRLDALKLDKLTHDQWLLAKTLRHSFEAGTHAEDNYWFSFAVTPYAGGQPISTIHAILAAQPLSSDESAHWNCVYGKGGSLQFRGKKSAEFANHSGIGSRSQSVRRDVYRSGAGRRGHQPFAFGFLI